MIYGGFEAYVEGPHPKRGGTEEKMQDKNTIKPGDTAAFLKLQRNGGRCENPGCDETENVEWHHHIETWSCNEAWAAAAAERGVYGVESGIKKYVSSLQPTLNPAVLAEYAAEMDKCT